MTVGSTALARCVGDVERFARESWGCQAVVRRRACSFVDLVDVDVVERLLTAPARRPMFRVVRDGSPLPVADYTSSRRLGGEVVDDVVDVARVMRLLADGATVVLQSLECWWPPIARFCEDLQAETSHPVQANSYLSPAGSSGLARHRDGHEVLVLQVEGSKAWDVEGLGAVTLEPGDVLYMPAGTSHEAAAQDQFSLHLTVGILAVTYRRALRRALDAFDSAELDRPLPIGYAKPGARRTRSTAVAAFAAAIDRIAIETDPTVVVDTEVRRSKSRRPLLPSGHLRALLDPPRIDDESWIQAHPQLTVSATGSRILLQAVGRRLDVPGTIGDAVVEVAGGTALSVGLLTGLDEGSRAVFASRLVREGLAFVVDPPRHTGPPV